MHPTNSFLFLLSLSPLPPVFFSFLNDLWRRDHYHDLRFPLTNSIWRPKEKKEEKMKKVNDASLSAEDALAAMELSMPVDNLFIGGWLRVIYFLVLFFVL